MNPSAETEAIETRRTKADEEDSTTVVGRRGLFGSTTSSKFYATEMLIGFKILRATPKVGEGTVGENLLGKPNPQVPADAELGDETAPGSGRSNDFRHFQSCE
ncbi:hypothetical protein SDJN03_12119, partial [Cucurbita argyrosperma subsp. sororia]